MLSWHAGAPLANTTFYCHAVNQLCYWLRGTATNNNGAAKTFMDASYECKGLNGELAVYSSKREQLNVEVGWLGAWGAAAPPFLLVLFYTASQQIL